jgi:hypothetical protein
MVNKKKLLLCFAVSFCALCAPMLTHSHTSFGSNSSLFMIRECDEAAEFVLDTALELKAAEQSLEDAERHFQRLCVNSYGTPNESDCGSWGHYRKRIQTAQSELSNLIERLSAGIGKTIENCPVDSDSIVK